MRLTLVGHSTVLIECGGTRLLTDPWFASGGNPAYARVTPPVMTRDEVGALDGVLVSHPHWDHTDRRFFRGLDPAVPVLVPAGTGGLMRLKGVRSPEPLRPWTSLRLGEAVATAVPALHLAPAVGYVIQTLDACVYFAGDTYYRPFMAEIGRRFAVDAALLPVTTYRLPMTMGEEGAVQAVRALGAPLVIPIHLGIRPRSPLLRTRQTPAGFERRLRAAGVGARVVHLAAGESFEVPAPSAAAEPGPAAAVG